MNNSVIEVAQRSSSTTDFANLMVIAGSVLGGKCNVLVGSPGLPIVVQKMRTGDTILYDTLGDGVMEVKLTSIHEGRLELLVAPVS